MYFDGTGVHSVDVKFEKDEVTVKGAIDAKAIHQRLEKWSKKKVEIVSQDKFKEVEKATNVKKVGLLHTSLSH